MQFLKTFGPYRDKDGRARVIHYWDDKGRRRTTTEGYARYLWKQHYGEIPPGMTVDHIDGNCANDKLENYQLLSRRENVKKAHKDDPTLARRANAVAAANRAAMTDEEKRAREPSEEEKKARRMGLLWKYRARQKAEAKAK